jgi:hypothetical protein
LYLYDIAADPGETKELSAAMPEKTKELQDKLHQWQKSVGAQPMQLNPDFNEKKETGVLRIRKGMIDFFFHRIYRSLEK